MSFEVGRGGGYRFSEAGAYISVPTHVMGDESFSKVRGKAMLGELHCSTIYFYLF